MTFSVNLLQLATTSEKIWFPYGVSAVNENLFKETGHVESGKLHQYDPIAGKDSHVLMGARESASFLNGVEILGMRSNNQSFVGDKL